MTIVRVRIAHTQGAVLVQVAHAQEGRPGTDVVPLELGAHHGDVRAALHQTVIDGQRGRLGEKAGHVLTLEASQLARQLGRVGRELGQQHLGPPDEHPRVPEEAAVREERLGRGAIGLLDEAAHLEHLVGQRFGQLDVAIPGLGPGGGDPHGEKAVQRARRPDRAFQRALEDLERSDHVVAVQRDHDRALGLASPGDDLAGGPGEGGGGAACLGLEQELLRRQVRQVLPELGPQALAGHHQHVVSRCQGAGTLERVEDEGPGGGQRQELLGTGRGAGGPEARSDPARQQNDPTLECRSFAHVRARFGLR